MVAELSRKEIHRSAHSLESQGDAGGADYLERYEHARDRIETLEQEKLERTAKPKAIGRFIRSIREASALISGFNKAL